MKKYLRHYYKLVNRAFLQNRKRSDKTPYEGHHVKPKCLGSGGLIVLLTAKEHFIAHFLLYKHFKHNNNKNAMLKMSYAFNMMTWQSDDNIKRYTSRSFAIARREFAKNNSGENNWNFGKIKSPEVIQKISDGLKAMSEEKRRRMKKRQRKAKLGGTRPHSAIDKQIKSIQKRYKHLEPKYRLILKDGTEHLSSTYSYLIQKFNLSKSMLCLSKHGEPIKYGDPQSRIRTEKTENTVGCILFRLTN